MENNKHTLEASPKMLALKIDVDTFKGTKIGVPNLLGLLKKHQADATFLFSLGPDHTGRAIKRVFHHLALRHPFAGARHWQTLR